MRFIFLLVLLVGVYNSLDTGETMIVDRDGDLTTVLHNDGRTETILEIN